MCIHIFKNLKATRLLVLFIKFYGITVKTRLLQNERGSHYRNYRRGSFAEQAVDCTGNNISTKQWIGCCLNHSFAYTAKVEVRGTLGLCNRRILRLAINKC